MSKRLSKIITKTGDKGSTGLADGSRRAKSDIRIHCLGEVDELNAVVGLCASSITHEQIEGILLHIQHDLFDLGAELCQPSTRLIQLEHVDQISQQAQTLNADLPDLKEFILPGGSIELANLHLARTVCRRVERHVVELNTKETVNPDSLMYLNRLSDLFFILTRYLAQQTGQQETYWKSTYSRIKPDQ